MAKRKQSSQPRRHRMRNSARRDSARAWIASGAVVSLKAYAKRYGVDKYTAYEDLAAIGFSHGPREAHWAQRPPSAPRHREEPIASDIEWIQHGDEIMFVVGYTPGGAPYGCVHPADKSEDAWSPPDLAHRVPG